MNSMHHEKILIDGLKEGNERIFDYLFHLYYSGLVVYARKYVDDQQTAEDIVQDFFVKLWIKRSALQINQSLKSYCFTSIKNRCFDVLRHQQVRTKTAEILIQESVDQLADDHFYIESELQQQIQNAIDKLPTACREIFMMNRFDGLKPAEIAEKKGISVRTVEGHIGKALRLLKTELEEYLPASIVLFILNSLT